MPPFFASQVTIESVAADPKRPCYLRLWLPCLNSPPYLCNPFLRHLLLTAFVDAFRFRELHTLLLALLGECPFKLSEGSEHVQHQFAKMVVIPASEAQILSHELHR